MSQLSPESSSLIEERGNVIFKEQYRKLCIETDRLFAKFLLIQWVASICVAFFISPQTWIGSTAFIHIHVWMAIFIGGLFISLPLYLISRQPGEYSTRIVIAISQMLCSALLIHLSGGRIETHFHIFGSLAFLACYRDWKVLVAATVVVAIDHFMRGVWWPLSVFGVVTESPYRWIEHAGWVVFADVFLIRVSLRGVREHKSLCQRQAELESVNIQINEEVERQVHQFAEANAQLDMEILEKSRIERELKEREFKLRKIMSSTNDPMITINSQGIVLEASLSTYEVLGWMPDELIGREISLIIPENLLPRHQAALKLAMQNETAEMTDKVREVTAVRKDGTLVLCEILIWKTLIPGQNAPLFTGILRDISLQKKAEEEREDMYAQLLDSTRQAGMAEVATGVLHNVGNVLNSVNVSVNLIEEKMKQSQVSGLTKATKLLNSHRENLGEYITTDAKGRHLPEYLTKLSRHLASENESVLSEILELSSNIGHIKDIVSMQQSYAQVSGTSEMINISEILENALKTNISTLHRHSVEVIREFEEIPLINSDKHKLMQILVNLVTNAKQALKENEQDRKRLILSLKKINDDHVQIEIEDNGIGILKDNLSKIFQHGFTTKNNGHGFGLHSCALAAKEMGGSLSVYSEGEEKGARFTLTLPVEIERI